MSPVASAAVKVRRLLVKRPWIYWLMVAAVALGAAASVLDHVDRVDAERAAWGEVATVFVATGALTPGDPVAAESRSVPLAVVPDDVALDPRGLVMRQHIGAGEIITGSDVTAAEGPQAMTPAGWLAVPINESPASGGALGDRVRITSEGIVISADAVIVGLHHDVTLVAAPGDEAPSIAAANLAGGVTLLLEP